MFGHLQAEDFVNLMEGTDLPAKQQSHIRSCARCRSTWDSMRAMRTEMSSMESDIPEPDWTQFRSSVRDELLSRSIQRQTAVRRWTGWAGRPAVAWALSVLMAVGITTVTVLWRAEPPVSQPPHEPVPVEQPAEIIEAGPERSLFDDVVSLGEAEQEQLRRMLESDQKGAASQR